MTTTLAAPRAATVRSAPARIPTSRIVGVELRKMFDTRSGFWMMVSIVALEVIATGAVILFAPDAELTYNTFAAAIGVPLAVILPMVAALSVTSEWTQRSGLTTFTLIPERDRVIRAKAVAALLVGVVSMVAAFAVGALGNVVGTTIAGTDLVWDIAYDQVLTIVLGNILGMMLGFTLGALIRNSSGAVVTYLVYSFVFPPLLGLLAAGQEWFRDLQPWVDFNFAQSRLFEGEMSGEAWAQLGSATTLWLALPLLVGVLLMRRSEVK
ncbi:MAG TPA: ABC transporter permease [Nocardioidaceae bacterium]|nr:ABC transporter permease [Nocardioidaceae bacterium]